jgi:hypothetical protein
MLTLIKNVLTEEENRQIINFFYQYPDPGWIDVDINDVQFKHFPLRKILEVAGQYQNLSKTVGCECWSHFNTGPPWHIDRDDLLFHQTGEIQTPICSIVYYARINNLRGGNFKTRTESITPVHNSMLMFGPGIEHAIDEFNGERISIAINPWDHKIRL